MSPYTEQAITFDCLGSRLLGIIAAPASGHLQADTSVLVVVGGPQYRAGSHRQFVQLSRALAAAGHIVLRFDVRGMGDSQGAASGFEAVTEDIRAAIGALEGHASQAKRIALFGLCDGASAALLYLHDTGDARVGALCLLNPWVRSAQSLARTHVRHYYVQRLFSREFWRKLLTGGIGKGALAEFVRALRRSQQATHSVSAAPLGARRKANFRDAMRSGYSAFSGPILLALSGNDLTATEFGDSVAADATWRKLLTRRGTKSIPLQGADHTLSSPGAQAAFEAAMIKWLRSFAPAPASPL